MGQTILVLGGVALAAAELGRRIYRNTQVFCPERAPVKSWDPADYGIPREAVQEYWIETPDGEELYAWYCRAEHPRASMVFCHGNTGNLTTTADAIPHFLAGGINTLFFDYRGFGKSTGRVTYRGVLADGVTAARFHEKIRPKALPSILYGYSLGGGVAAQVLRKHPFDALILQSTFTNLTQVTRHLYPKIPLHLLAGDLFDTVGIVKRLQVPLLVLHGTADETCPCWMGTKIFEACPTPKRVQYIEGGMHKDLFARDPDALIWAMTQFIDDLPRTHRTWSVDEPSRVEQWADSALRTLRRAFRKVPA